MKVVKVRMRRDEPKKLRRLCPSAFLGQELPLTLRSLRLPLAPAEREARKDTERYDVDHRRDMARLKCRRRNERPESERTKIEPWRKIIEGEKEGES